MIAEYRNAYSCIRSKYSLKEARIAAKHDADKCVDRK